jgi:hypothetical protein
VSPRVFVCPVCRMTSANPNDVATRYCGNCHRFVDDAVIARDETGQRHVYASGVANVLLQMEVLRRDPVSGEFVIRASEANLAAANPHVAVCDLCSATPVVFVADVGDFLMILPGAPPWRSTEGFYLCETCGGLVSAGRREALRARAGDAYPRVIGPAISILHHNFWKHYRGIRPLEEVLP